jgi:hypothetical protein
LISIHPRFTCDLTAKFENEEPLVLYKKDKWAQKYMEKRSLSKRHKLTFCKKVALAFSSLFQQNHGKFLDVLVSIERELSKFYVLYVLHIENNFPIKDSGITLDKKSKK